MKRLALSLLVLLYSAVVCATAKDDFKAGFAASGKGDFQSARQEFESGFDKLQHGENVTESERLSAAVGLGTVYVATGELQKARQLVEPVVEKLEKNGPPELYAATVQVLFYVDFFSRDDVKALQKLARLIELQKQLPAYYKPGAIALSYTQQALLQDRNGDTVAAVDSQQSAINLYRESLPGDLNALITAYTTLVDYHEKLGQHAAVLQALKEKLALMEPHGKTYEQEIYNTKIRIRKTGQRLAQTGPDVDNPYGTDLEELLAKQQAVDLPGMQQQLLENIEKFGEDSPLVASFYTTYGDTLSGNGYYDYALQVYDIAETMLEKLYGKDSPNLAELHLKRGNALKLAGGFDFELTAEQRERIKTEYRLAINTYNRLYGDAHPLTISALHALYETARLENNFFANFDIANRLFNAYSEYEKASFTHLGRKQKLAFRQQYKDIAERFIEASWLTQAHGDDYPDYPQLDLGRPDWQAEQERKVSLYEKQLAAYKERRQQPLRGAFESWINHKGSINAIDNTLTLARQSATSDAVRARIDMYFDARKKLAALVDSAKDWQQQQAERKRLRALAAKSLQQLYMDIPSLSLDNRINLDDLRKRIPANAIYLDFVKLYTYQYAVFSYDAAGEVRLHRLGDDQVSIEQRVKKIRDLINDTIDGNIRPKRSERLLKKELAELYDRVIRQIPGVIAGFDELIISADGLLALMPFGLLYDDKNDEYLIEKYSIRTVPSARALVRRSASSAADSQDAVILADPDFNYGSASSPCTEQTGSRSLTLSVLRNFDKPCIGQLPATAKEAASIKAALNTPAATYLRAKASEKTLRQQQHPGILHIATHGFFLPDPAITNPLEKAGLILSGANTGIANRTGQGVVTGLKLAAMDLRGTRLVVLSACETGVGDIEQGEGVAGLNQAFMRAGAQGVIMSLWRVPDVQTAELMKRMYGAMVSGMSPAAALRKAQRSLVKDGEHPLAWAAFTYSG